MDDNPSSTTLHAGVGEVEDAWKLLLDFNRADTRITATGTTKEQRVSLREAVLVRHNAFALCCGPNFTTVCEVQI